MVSSSDSPVSSPHAFVLLDTLDSQNVHHSGSSVQCTRLTELTRVPDGTRPRQAFSRCIVLCSQFGEPTPQSCDSQAEAEHF